MSKSATAALRLLLGLFLAWSEGRLDTVSTLAGLIFSVSTESDLTASLVLLGASVSACSGPSLSASTMVFLTPLLITTELWRADFSMETFSPDRASPPFGSGMLVAEEFSTSAVDLAFTAEAAVIGLL